MGKFSNGKEITENLLASCCRDISSEITPNIYLGNELYLTNFKCSLDMKSSQYYADVYN